MSHSHDRHCRGTFFLLFSFLELLLPDEPRALSRSPRDASLRLTTAPVPHSLYLAGRYTPTNGDLNYDRRILCTENGFGQEHSHRLGRGHTVAQRGTSHQRAGWWGASLTRSWEHSRPCQMIPFAAIGLVGYHLGLLHTADDQLHNYVAVTASHYCTCDFDSSAVNF